MLMLSYDPLKLEEPKFRDCGSKFTLVAISGLNYRRSISPTDGEY